MNQLFAEVSAMALEAVHKGIPDWDAEVDYLIYAMVVSGSDIWQATEATGPGTSNSTDPQGASQTIWTKVARSIEAPAKMAAPTATAGVSQSFITWLGSLDNFAEITSYSFRWREGTTGAWNTPVTIPDKRTFYTLSGLTNGTEYQVAVAAINSQGTGAWSDAVSTTPSAGEPAQVDGIVATAGNASISLAWNEPNNFGAAITTYTVQWKSGSQAYASGRQAKPTTNSGSIASLTNGTEYTIRIRATNSVGDGAWSEEVTATPVAPPAAVPDKVGLVAGVVASATSITWSWSAPSNNGAAISSYDVRVRETGGSWPTSGFGEPATNEYTSTSLTTGTAYEASVRATNSEGDGAWSDASAAVTPQATPAAAVITATQGNKLVSIAWTAPDNGGSAITGYNLQHSTEATESSRWDSPTTVTPGATATSYSVTGLTNGTAVWFRLQAVSSVGNGAWSNVVTTTPRPGTVTVTSSGNWTWI